MILRAQALDLRTFAQAADWLAVGVAVSLPWSTSATAILIVLWLIALLPTLDVAVVRRELATFAGGLPVLLWLLAAVGMLWADVTWSERINGLGGYHRLLAIPLLLAQFRRSELGTFVLYAFLVSAICLLALSWVTVLIPALAFHGKPPGIPVKDYVSQNGIFLICAFGLFGVACEAWRRHKWHVVAAFAFLGALFVADIAFIITSRTAIMVAPFLVVLLGWRQSGLKGAAAAVLIGTAVSAALWLASPHLQQRTLASLRELRTYFINADVNSTSLHLAFLNESILIVKSAPLIGHGTGSISEQFRDVTASQAGVSGVATVNPHNQIFAVAIQLGAVGVAVLLAMWAAHVVLFRGGGMTAWIGTIVVVENVVSCLANSHLFDFSQGWFYVFGVGVAGGEILRQRDHGLGSVMRRREGHAPG